MGCVNNDSYRWCSNSLEEAGGHYRAYLMEVERRYSFYTSRIDPHECHFAIGQEGLGFAYEAGGNEWLSRLFIQDIYDLWENRCRSEIAKALGFIEKGGKNNVTHPLMGELRVLRNLLHQQQIRPLSEVSDKSFSSMTEIPVLRNYLKTVVGADGGTRAGRYANWMRPT